MPWTPPERERWVDRLNAYGRGLGDDGRSLVSLRAEDLLDAARSATGLHDAGDDWFREPMARLCTALDDEAGLHLAGRVRARAELQVILQNRLRLVDLWAAEPAIGREVVAGPIIVTGLGRSGTTFLHELLSCDPANRPPLLWELVHTVPGAAARTDTAGTTGTPGAAGRRRSGEVDWAGVTHGEITLMDAMIPAFTAMHENGGHLPTECIFAFAHQFSSDQFTGLYNVPGYTIWRSGVDQAPIYDWHRRMLQTLQWATPTERWVVKAPSHLSALSLVFATYPDARVVINHRDPLRVVGSLADTMATLHWMHSDRVAYDTLIEFLCMGVEIQMNEVTKERDGGSLPGEQIADVRYRDLVADPMAVVRRLYAGWDLALSAEAGAAMEAYLAARHTGRGAGEHRYRFEDTGLELAEHRALVADYQARFDVPSEV
ncbi:MAG TPA: sulfotransferase [Acidimicrobiales bacterium]|nr:sulfotransferase [Acidimicrobiales bacterium]